MPRIAHWLAWPSWIIARVLISFAPGTHPWKARSFFTLREWHAGQTDIARQADVVLAIGFALLFYFLAKWVAGLF